MSINLQFYSLMKSSSVSMTCGLFCVNTSLTCIPLLVKLFRKIRSNLEKEEVFIIR